MLRRVDLLSMAAGLLLLAGCASGQTASQTGAPAALPMQRGHSPSTIQPDKGCAGSRHVDMTPCPVLLTADTKDGIVVTVKGRHVADSAIGKMTSCFNADHCYNVARVGSSRTQWLFTSGPACGDALVKFRARNADGRRIGIYYLEVSNTYCPS